MAHVERQQQGELPRRTTNQFMSGEGIFDLNGNPVEKSIFRRPDRHEVRAVQLRLEPDRRDERAHRKSSGETLRKPTISEASHIAESVELYDGDFDSFGRRPNYSVQTEPVTQTFSSESESRSQRKRRKKAAKKATIIGYVFDGTNPLGEPISIGQGVGSIFDVTKLPVPTPKAEKAMLKVESRLTMPDRFGKTLRFGRSVR